MEMQLAAIKPNLITAVGDLSGRKLELLDNYLLPKYSEKQIPMPEAVLYINPPDRSSVVIGSHQIGFGVDGEPIGDYFRKIITWREQSKEIADILLLDSNCIAHEFQLIGIVKAFPYGNKSATIKSIQKFSSIRKQNFKDQIGVDPIAVGLRYVFKKDNLIWDCNIEPHLANLSQFVLTSNIKIEKGNYSFDVAFDSLEICIDYFTKDWFGFIKNEILI